MDMKKLFLVFAILSLSLVQFSGLVYANDASGTIPEGAKLVLGDWLGFPDDWLTVRGFIYNFIVPFVGIWAIVLGFLRMIGIFSTETRLELIISFAMAFSTIPLNWFVPFVQWAFAAGGVWATVAFVALFIVGTTTYSLLKGRGFWGLGWGVGGVFDTQSKKLTNEIRRMEGKKSRLLREIGEKKGNKQDTTALEAKLDKLESEIRAKVEARRYLARA